MPEFNYMPVHAGRSHSLGLTGQEVIAMEHLVASPNDHTNVPSSHDDELTNVSNVSDPDFVREISRQTSIALVEASKDPQKPIPKPILSIFRSWWREIVAMLTSIAALIAIAGILYAYQDQPLSTWRFQYLPNSIASQLMTISRSALMFSTASTISQALWNYMRQEPRALIEVQSFDDASRGPFGAVLMLAYASRYCFPGILGSFITVATLLMESFTQQVLQYPWRIDSGDKNGTFPVTQRFVYSHYQQLSASESVNSSVQAHIVDSVLGNPPSDAFACPSDSCSWGPASTLGICSTCKDVSTTSKSNCSSNPPNHDCNYTTPSGLFLQTHALDMDEYTSIYTSANYSRDIEVSTLISFASLVWDGIFYDKPPTITECTLSWCAKTYYNAASRNGLFSATVTTHDLEYAYSWEEPNSLTLVDWDVFETKENDLPEGSNSTFTIHRGNLESLGAFIDTVLQAGISNGYYQFQSGTLAAGSFNFGNLMLNNPTISDMGDSLARGLTNVIRSMSTPYTNQFLGTSYGQIQYIQVRWQWLIFPASIVFLGLFLLVFTIVQSHLSANEIWKISALALLFHPLQGWSDEDLNKDGRSEMMNSARSMRGQLVFTEHAGYRIVRKLARTNETPEL